METQSTHLRLIPCEHHAAILGRQAALFAQRPEADLRDELLTLIAALMNHRMDACSPDQCIVGDEE